MNKVLVYKVELLCDPNKGLDVAKMIEALKPFGIASVIGSQMRKAER